VAHPDLRPAVLRAAKQAGLRELTLISNEFNYDLMARADLMVVKSGTSLHECALMDAPAVMCYRVPRFVAGILRRLMRFSFPFYGLPNLLLNREIVPELIQEECNELRIAEVAGELLFNEKRREEMRSGYAEVRAKLCPGGELTPLQNGAQMVQKLLSGR
jgi:lipid-A-disaccharide synthase